MCVLYALGACARDVRANTKPCRICDRTTAFSLDSSKRPDLTKVLAKWLFFHPLHLARALEK